MQTIMIVSPSAGEGKTTVAANLGVAIAQSGQNVCLIDANLRRPEIHNRLNIPNQGGLSHVLESKKSKTSIKHYLQSTRLPNLKVLTSGEIPSSPSEILNSPRLSDALEGLKADSNIILIDTPPTTAVTDAMELIPFVDGVLIVVKAGYTKPELASQLVKQLQRVNANILGIVGNNFSSQTPRYRSRQHIDKVQVFIQFVKINTQKLLQQVKSWIYPKFPSDIQ